MRQALHSVQSGPQSTEAAAAELAPPATSAAPHALDPGSPRSQGSFNIFNLSPQDFSLSPLHRGHNDSQQVSYWGSCDYWMGLYPSEVGWLSDTV